MTQRAALSNSPVSAPLNDPADQSGARKMEVCLSNLDLFSADHGLYKPLLPSRASKYPHGKAAHDLGQLVKWALYLMMLVFGGIILALLASHAAYGF